MTEAAWQGCEDPRVLLDALTTGDSRRFRLFACACCRRIDPALTPLGRRAIDLAERSADDDAARGELLAIQPQPPGWSGAFGRGFDAGTAVALAASVQDAPVHCLNASRWAAMATGDVPAEWRAQAALARCIFGNPFRPVTPDPRWRTSAAIALASAMYESRDFGAMPILGDALEESGCDNSDVLAHCRGPGPHVRGCWVVDSVLGKE